MKSENNGKIAIAVVAMFVVALSIVGFTYAYFTAQVQGNTADKSVEVTAGRLEIVYANGNEILAQNIVPGWVSNGDYYFDTVCSSTDENEDGIYEIKAVSKSAIAEAKNKCSETDQRTPATLSPTTADGLTDKVTFSVSNSAENTADNSYIIRLTNITNGLAEADRKNFFVTLYDGEDAVVWSGNLAASGTQVIVPAARTIADDDETQNYSISLTYKNIEGAQSSKGVGVKATVEVIGVVENDDSEWVDADGRTITFASPNTNEPTNGLS